MLVLVFTLLIGSVASAIWLIRSSVRHYRRAKAMEICHHCAHELTPFAGGRMPQCPECGKHSGPRTRHRAVTLTWRTPQSKAMLVIALFGPLFALTLGPVISAITSGNRIGTGTSLFICEYGFGSWRTDLIDSLCLADERSPLQPSERIRLADLVLADVRTGRSTLTGVRRNAMLRLMSVSALTPTQMSQYQSIRETSDAMARAKDRAPHPSELRRAGWTYDGVRWVFDAYADTQSLYERSNPWETLDLSKSASSSPESTVNQR